MSDNEYHDFTQREADDIYVEVWDQYGEQPAGWQSYTRVAQKGADKIIRDGSFPRSDGRDIRLVWNWGSGPTVVIRDGKVVEDDRPTQDA